jgi:hypothetical protein
MEFFYFIYFRLDFVVMMINSLWQESKVVFELRWEIYIYIYIYIYVKYFYKKRIFIHTHQLESPKKVSRNANFRTFFFFF